MQVSWIDPDEVRTLFTQIAGPERPINPSAWEVHTLPVAPPASSEAFRLLGDMSSNDSQTPEPELRDHPVGPGNAEVWRIREKLRALREKAQASGILARPAAPVAEANVTSPNPPPQPSAEPVTASVPATTPVRDYEPLFASPAVTAAVGPVEAATPSPIANPDFAVPAAGLGDRLNALAQWVCERLHTPDVLIVDDYGDVLWGGSAQTPLVLSAIMAWQSAQHSTASATTSNTPSRIDKDLSGGRSLTILSSRTRYGVVNLAIIGNAPLSEADAAALQDAVFRTVEG